jgi:hypothetical protein
MGQRTNSKQQNHSEHKATNIQGKTAFGNSNMNLRRQGTIRDDREATKFSSLIGTEPPQTNPFLKRQATIGLPVKPISTGSQIMNPFKLSNQPTAGTGSIDVNQARFAFNPQKNIELDKVN